MIDVSAQLSKYLVQELFGFKENKGKVIAALITLAFPAMRLSSTIISPEGKPIRSFLAVWPVFGASNQLL